MAGTGVGQMIMPHVVGFLLDNYGFQGTILIMGGLALNGVKCLQEFSHFKSQFRYRMTLYRWSVHHFFNQ